MSIKLSNLNKEEVYIGFSLQFLLYFVIHWMIIPVQVVCGLMWAIGGNEDGSKLFRRLVVPFVVCGATFITLHEWMIFLAIPFMVWGCPWSYGADSWLFKAIKSHVHDQRKSDFLTHGILYIWYWGAYSTFLVVGGLK